MIVDDRRVPKTPRILWKRLRCTQKQPTPEQIHDLRTAIRRHETALRTFRRDSKRNERRSLSDLKRLRKRAGKLRDLDVFTAKAATLRINGEADCVVRLLEHLGAERARHAKKLRAVVKNTAPSLRPRLKRTRTRIADVLGDGKQLVEPAAALIGRALAVAAELPSRCGLNHNTLDPYRLNVKELRDVLQMFAGADRHKFVDTLGEVKDAIGEWHDWQCLTAIAGDTVVADHPRDCALPRALKAESERAYTRALSITNRMRTQGLATLSHRRGSVTVLPTLITDLASASA